MRTTHRVCVAVTLLLVFALPSVAKDTNRNNYPVTVDYNRPLQCMIKDGIYVWRDSGITSKNFPVEGKGKAKVTIKLVQFNKFMGSDEVLKKLEKLGLRPATLPELLAFGATYPNKQRKFPIVALGSVWRYWEGYRFVPYLWENGARRDLGLGWLERGWDAYYRFAAVRK